MKNTVSGLAAAACLSIALLAGAAAPADAKVLARVNGVEINEDDLKIALEDIGQGLPPQVDGQERDAYLLEYLIDLKLAARRAEAEKMTETPDFARRMAYQRDKALMEVLFGKIAQNATSDAELRKVYNEVAGAQGPEQEVRARHILVGTEDEAKTVARRVRGGEDFAKVADAVSKDPGSKGGDLGWFTRERMVGEFSEVAFKLGKGQISDPVKTQFGWHVIKVEDTRTKPFPDFELVKDQVRTYVIQKSQSDQIAKLRESAKIEKLDAPVPAPSPVPAPRR